MSSNVNPTSIRLPSSWTFAGDDMEPETSTGWAYCHCQVLCMDRRHALAPGGAKETGSDLH
eukprot:246750-Rhodomonas_salina.1